MSSEIELGSEMTEAPMELAGEINALLSEREFQEVPATCNEESCKKQAISAIVACGRQAGLDGATAFAVAMGLMSATLAAGGAGAAAGGAGGAIGFGVIVGIISHIVIGYLTANAIYNLAVCAKGVLDNYYGCLRACMPLAKTGVAGAARTAASRAMARVARGVMPAEKTCWVQTVLNQAEGETLVPDGIYGPLTRGAVQRFQTRYGLSADGIVGPPAETALVQTGLNRIAQATLIPVNGIMDATTRQEILRFQSGNGLVADGIVGPRTRAGMVAALGGRCALGSVSGSPLLAPWR